MDTEDLLVKVGSGAKLKPQEVEEVVAMLETVDLQELGRKLSVDDVYALLLIVAKSKNLRFRPLLDRYLDAEDSLTVSMLLETLCLEWGPIEEYLERLINFALGVSFDREDDLRQAAIKILGEYLYAEVGKRRLQNRTKIDPRAGHIIGLLFALFDDRQLGAVVRQSAYYALLRAYGKEWEEIPSEYARLDLENNTDRDALLYLREFSSSPAGGGVSSAFSPGTR